MADIKPVHQHDCDKCTHIGVVKVQGGQLADLYKSCSAGAGTLSDKFILRFSSEGSDYATTNNVSRYL